MDSISEELKQFNSSYTPFSSVSDLMDNLRNNNLQILQKGLYNFSFALKKIIGKYNSKSIIDVSKEENLFREYINKSPECEELFNIWKYQQNNQIVILETIILELLTKVIQVTKLIGFKTNGISINRIIIRNYLKTIYRTLSSGNIYPIQSTLRLLIAIASHSSATTKELQETFDFSLKSLNKLLNIRRKKQFAEKIDKDDVRSLYIKFIMSFIIYGDVIVKKNVLELKNFLNLIFKDMNRDSYQLVNYVFSNLKKYVIDDDELPRTVKINFFNSFILEEILKIYKSEFKEYINEEEEKTRQARTVPDVIHEFLLYICCNPGIGVCFQDAGWYTATAKSSISKNKNIRIYNKILSKFITVIDPTEDLKQQELLLSILKACPELIPVFWQTVGLHMSFEPRLSSKWLGNIILAQKIISLPIPKNLVNVNNLQEPPSINNVISNIFPPPISRALLSRGLQHSSYLIKYMCLMVLCYSFMKLQNVVENINNIKYIYEQKYFNQGVLENSNINSKNIVTSSALVTSINASLVVSKWKEYSRLLLNEIKKNIPDVQIILSLHHQISDYSQLNNNSNDIDLVAGNDLKSKKDLILGLILTIIKFYHSYMNEALLESRFDFGKLITSDVSSMSPEIQYNLLELIGEISDLKWWNKNENNKTHLSTLLNLYLSTPFSEIQSLTLSILIKMLSRSPVFKSCTREISIWFDSMKRTFIVPSKQRQLIIDFFNNVICSVVQDPYKIVDIMLEIENQCKKKNGYIEKYNEMNLLLNQNENDQSKLIYSLIVYPSLNALMKYQGENKVIISRYICYVLISICDLTQKVPDYLLLTISKIASEFNISLKSVNELYWKENWDEIDWISASYQYLLRISYKNDSSMDIDNEMNELQVKNVHSKFQSIIKQDSNLTLQALVKFLNQLSPGQFVYILPKLLNELDDDKYFNRVSEYIRLHFPYCGSLFNYISDDFLKYVDSNRWSRLLYRIPFRCIFTNFALINKYHQIKNLYHYVIYSLNKIENKKYMDIYNEVSLFLTEENIKYLEFDIINLFFRIYSILIKENNEIIEHVLANPIINENFIVNDVITNRLLYIMEENINCNKSSKIWINYFVKTRNYIVDHITKSNANKKDISYSMLTLFHIFNKLMSISDINLILENLFKNININDHVSIKLLEIVLSSSTSITENNNSVDTTLIEKLFKLFESNSSSQLDNIIYKIILNSKDYNFIVHSDNDVHDKLVLYENIQTLIKKSFVDFILENMNELRAKILSILIKNDPRICHWVFSSKYWKNIKVNKENINILSSFLLTEDDVKIKYINIIDKKFKNILLERVIDRINFNEETRDKLTDERKRQIKEEVSLLSNIIKSSTLENKSKEYYEKIFALIRKQASKLKSMSVYLIDIHSLQMDCYKSIVVYYLKNSEEKTSHYGEIITLLLQCILSINQEYEINKDCALEVELFQQLNSIVDEIMIKEDKNNIVHSVIQSMFNINQLILDDYIKHILAEKFESYEIMNSLLKLINLLYIQWKNMPSMLVSPNFILDNILSNKKYIDCVVKGISDIKLNNDQENFSKSPIPIFTKVKEVIINLIEFLIECDPMKCCKPSYLPQIMAAYNATISEVDKRIFKILKIFETKAGVSVADASILWSYSSLDIRERNQERNHLNNGIMVVEIMNLIDSNWMGYTVQWYGMNDVIPLESSENQKDNIMSKRLTPLYDQDFFLPLFAQLLNIAGTKFDIHRFIELNCFGLVVMALSSTNVERRKVGYFLIDQLYGILGSSNLREKKQLLLLCDSFKNSIVDRDTPQRVPNIISLFVAQSLLIFTKPDHYMYPLINRFLLQRPWIDLEDIPLLYNLLYSSSDNYKQERTYILRLLSCGFQDKNDFKPYRRRHVSNLLNSLFHSNLSDISIRKYIIEIYIKLSSNSSVIVDLIIQNGLLSWIQSTLAEFNIDSKNELLIGFVRLINSIWKSWKEADSTWYKGEEGMKNWGNVFISIFYQLVQPVSNLLKNLKSRENNKSKINYQWWLNYFFEIINYIYDIITYSKENFNIEFKLNSYPILRLIVAFDLLIKQYHDVYTLNNNNGINVKSISSIEKSLYEKEDDTKKYYEMFTKNTGKLNKYYDISLNHKIITNLDNLYSLKPNQFNNYIELLQKLLQTIIIGIDYNDLIYHQKSDVFINWIIHSLIKLNNFRESAYNNGKMELTLIIDNNITSLYGWIIKSHILKQYLKSEQNSLSLIIGILNKQLLFSKCSSEKESNFNAFVKKQANALYLLLEIISSYIQNIGSKQGIKRSYSGDELHDRNYKKFYLEFETNQNIQKLIFEIKTLAINNYSNLKSELYKQEFLNYYYDVTILLRNSLFSILFYKNNYKSIIKEYINITNKNNYTESFIEKINIYLNN